jgi:CheY-like chemotaxis protein
MQGHRVLHAEDGPAALERLRAQRPPVAILDIGLPGMNGYELAQIARAELGADLLLIALTGYGGAADVKRARAAGFDFHLTKPVEMPELARILERATLRATTRPANQSGLSADQKIA